jgi:hypothetical protein
MDVQKLYQILNETTQQLRKGERMKETTNDAFKVTEIYDMPNQMEAFPNEDMLLTWEMVDIHFITIAVNLERAAARRDEFIAILDSWPNKELKNGPSYIAVGATIGDQGAAFQMFALGQALGLWKVITPEFLGMKGEQAAQAAGAGYIMITGYPQNAAPDSPLLKTEAE